MLLDESSRGWTVTACGPDPLSTVRTMPVRVFPEEILLLTLVLSCTDRFTLSVLFGAPVQLKTMSPMRSAKPSARTMVVAETVEQAFGCAAAMPMEPSIRKTYFMDCVL